jgi:MscS family membrane protein
MNIEKTLDQTEPLKALSTPLTSFLDSLKLDTLVTENGPTVWATLALATFAGLVAGRVAAWALGRLAKGCEAGGRPGRAQIVLDLIGPASLALLTIGLTVGMARLHLGLRGDPLPVFVGKTLHLLYAIVVFWYAYNLVNVIDLVMRRFTRDGDPVLDRQMVLLVSRSLRGLWIAIGTLYVAKSVFSQDIGAWLAGLGIAGLAVSLAAQDSLKNLFASVAILLDRSFRIGDSIVAGTCEGTVEDIGFRSTKVRTPSGHLVTLPNSNLVNNAIINVSRRPAVRRVATLSVSGKTPAEKLREAIAALAGIFDEDGIRGPVRPIINGAESLPVVRFEDFSAGDFKLTVTYWYAPATDRAYAAHAERVNLRIVEELQKAGVELLSG